MASSSAYPPPNDENGKTTTTRKRPRDGPATPPPLPVAPAPPNPLSSSSRAPDLQHLTKPVAGLLKVGPPPHARNHYHATPQSNESACSSNVTASLRESRFVNRTTHAPRAPPCRSGLPVPTAIVATHSNGACPSLSSAPVTTTTRLSPFAQAKANLRIQEHQKDWRRQLSDLTDQRSRVEAQVEALRTENSILENEVVEEMVDRHQARRRVIRDAPDPLQTESVLQDLAQRERECREAIEQHRTSVRDSEERIAAYRAQVDRRAEELVVIQDELERCVIPSWEVPRMQLADLQREVDRLSAAVVEESDATFGLSSEAAAVVRELHRLHQSQRDLELASAATELDRRAVCAAYEEAKGTIRVFCRVRGSAAGVALPSVPAAGRAETGAEQRDGPPAEGSLSDRCPVLSTTTTTTASERSSTSGSTSSACDVVACPITSDATARQPLPAPALLDGFPSPASCYPAARFEYPDSGTDRRCITVASTRENATSTGKRESLTTHEFDCVFPAGATQSDVFADVAALVDGAVDGYQVCILAYGQTGSGKTFTMEGDFHSEEHSGVIPRTMRRVFERTRSLHNDGWTYRLTCFVVEIYNDNIRDLLNPSDAYHRACVASEGAMPGKPHEIIHKGKCDTSITNVTEVVVESLDDVQRCLESASRRRTSAKTNLNERSSRSHCVFTLRLEGFSSVLKQRSLGNICLVDLAGSERVLESGVQGVQWREAVNINKSLSFLGDCICALGTPGAVVPWRNCKLTLLLQNYLGGDGAKVLMIVTVSDLEAHVSETLNSLRFATKVNHTRVGSARPRVVPSSS